MTLTPGLLDQRLTFYARQDNGADGFIRPVYVRTGTYWGRLDETADAQTIPAAPAAHMELRASAVATVMDGVPVPDYGVVRVGTGADVDTGTGPLYYVRGVVRKRIQRCQKITLEAVDPTALGTFDVFEPVEVLDGTHLVIPAAP